MQSMSEARIRMFTSENLYEYWETNFARNSVANWWQVIRDHYQEPQRHYHTLDHITEMFQHWDKNKSALQRPDLVALAIIFHYIIYDPKAPDNEEKSADLFMEFARDTDILKTEDADNVRDWILKTKQHKTDAHTTPGAYGQDDLHFFLDFDMAVLGRDQEDYRTYAEQIRQEYIHVPEEVFNTRRPQVLKKFLEIPNIFATQEFREKYEGIARRNIQEEIDRLESTGS